jgi:hypothetical protein
MNTALRETLIIGSDHAVASKLHGFLGPSLASLGSSTRRAPEDTAELLKLIESTRFDLIGVALPLHRPRLSELLKSVRWSESQCRSTPVVAVAEPENLAEVQPYLGRGLNRVLSFRAFDKVVFRSIEELLNSAPRVRMSAMVAIEVFLDNRSERKVTGLSNISSTGMLLQGSANYPEATSLRFELTLPGERDPLSGWAEVVRSTIRDREGVTGFAARFTELAEDDRQRLEGFLSRQEDARA